MTSASKAVALDATDRMLIDRLQERLPVNRNPYAGIAAESGLSVTTILERIRRLRETGMLTRFGPMFNAERMGGAFCLCAMSVPAERFEDVNAQVNAFPQVAHNYEREHEMNMWFVLATETPRNVGETASAIERETGLKVFLFPKEAEYFVGLKVPA